MRRPDCRALATILLLTCAAGCALPEVRPLAEGPTAGPSPYGPWYEQHWQVNAVMLEPADADTMASVEKESVGEPAYDDEAYAGGEPTDAAIPPDDSYEPLPPSEPGAADDMSEPVDANEAAPSAPRRPGRASGSGEPVRY